MANANKSASACFDTDLLCLWNPVSGQKIGLRPGIGLAAPFTRLSLDDCERLAGSLEDCLGEGEALDVARRMAAGAVGLAVVGRQGNPQILQGE